MLPDYKLFDALPGSGPSLAPRLLTALGEQRERFQNAGQLQRHSGVAPVTQRSGKKSWVHWRWQCPTFVRQTFVEWAAQPITNPSGLAPFTSSSVPKAAHIKSRYARSRSSGSVSFIAAG